jgi:hypothetical protein
MDDATFLTLSLVSRFSYQRTYLTSLVVDVTCRNSGSLTYRTVPYLLLTKPRKALDQINGATFVSIHHRSSEVTPYPPFSL